MSKYRRGLHFNDDWTSWSSPAISSAEQVPKFHRSLPGYEQTPLRKLDVLAQEIGVRAIYLKDEGNRLGLPSFKILGASWGAFRAIAARLNLPLDLDLDYFKQALKGSDISLYAATDGNHGRAVARMGCWLGLRVEIHVPTGMNASTIRFIESEGARVVRSIGTYDDAVLEAQTASNRQGGLLIQDFAFGDYEDVPQWIVDGYSTMMVEIEEQLGEQEVTHAFVPVGVGSFAQAVTSHFRREGSSTRVIAVEPDTAACLWKSLKCGRSTAIRTVPTIMAGLDCGTVSTTAWPILSKGLCASMTISDFEAHSAAVSLTSLGISAGPCSGSTIVVLRRLSTEDKNRLEIDSNSIIVFPCTEGCREYDVPLDVAVEDPIELTEILKDIDAAEPVLCYIAAWLEHRDVKVHWIGSTEDGLSRTGTMHVTTSNMTVMFDGDLDTATLTGCENDVLLSKSADGKSCRAAAAMVDLSHSQLLS